MKNKNKNITDPEILRRNAEDLLKAKQATNYEDNSNVDIIKLNHELAVHQIELEVQNKELIDTKEDLQILVEKYTGLYDFAPSGYLTLSNAGLILELNFYTAKILGKERTYLIKTDFAAFVSRESRFIFNDFLKNIFIKQTNISCEISLISEHNSTNYFYLLGSINKNGIQADINLIDISERKRSEEQQRALNDISEINKELEHSLHLNSDKDLFISVLAHDLRNPFGLILGDAELLSKNISNLKREEIKDLVDDIKKSTMDTYELLEDLLKWSRARIGKIPFVLQNLKFSDICREVFEVLKRNANKKNIKINYPRNVDINFVADADMIKAIFRNLVANAIKFTGTNGIINISAQKANQGITFSVSDNGIGIEPYRLPGLFDLTQFHSFHETQNGKGTGLGLLLCKEFIEKHGGKIWVQSEYGKGSSFYFNIPDHSVENVQKVFYETKNETHIKKLKVIIAEDNPALSIILSSLIKDYCKEILFAENGTEVVNIFSKNQDTDLILIDYHMPELNGYEAAVQIRALNKNVVIFVETADTYLDVIQNKSSGTINEFFFKPYNMDFFNQLMRKYFHE